MMQFKKGDFVKYKNNQGDICYGKIVKIDKFLLQVEKLRSEHNYDLVDVDDAEYVAPNIIDEATIRAIFRNEKDVDAISRYDHPCIKYLMKHDSPLCFEDIEIGFNDAYLKGDEAVKDWLSLITFVMSDICKEGFDLHDLIFKDVPKLFLPSDLQFVWFKLVDAFLIDADYEIADVKEMITHLKSQIELSVFDRDYPEDIKRFIINAMNARKEQPDPSVTDEHKALYHRILSEYCDADEGLGLATTAFGYYAGNEYFPQDIKKAEKYLKRLYEVHGSFDAACALGLIYYYGRSNNREPEYDKAFKYLSIASMGDSPQPKYMIADMMLNGYGIEKNEACAVKIIEPLYFETKSNFASSCEDICFAEIAFRMGNFFRDGTYYYEDPEDALKFYLQAEYALENRKAKGNFKDKDLMEEVKTEIQKMNFRLQYSKITNKVRYSTFEDLLSIIDETTLGYTLKALKNPQGDYSFKIVNALAEEDFDENLFVTEPRAGYCSILPELKVNATAIKGVFINGELNKRKILKIDFDYVEDNMLFWEDEPVAEIDAREFSVTFPKKRK